MIVHHPLVAADAKVVAEMRAQQAPFKGKLSGPDARPAFDDVMEHTPDAASVTYEPKTVGGVRGIWCTPEHARDGATILYLHGGAYVLGSANAYRHFAGQIAARTRTAVFVADYRLAPEHAFPSAVDDARAAYLALAETGDVAIVGDSAGGGLALVLSAAIRRTQPATAVIAMSPWADLALTGETMTTLASADPLLTRDMLAITAKTYLGGHDPRDPLASPLYADLSALPPTLIHVGGDEILLDDTLRYVKRARAVGVEATAHVWTGMPHVFPASIGTLAAADAALDTFADFLDANWTSNRVVPPDDPERALAIVDPDSPTLRHISMVGDTYTILLSGAETAGRYCLIDMTVPNCGGPGPHRHDFEEMFTILDGEIELTFRGEKHRLRAGMTVNVPANAPHFFTNVSGKTSRMLCMCSPAGQDEFFLAVGKAVASRTVELPKPTDAEKAKFIERATKLAPRFRTELLKP